jgi:hypothetical protein
MQTSSNYYRVGIVGYSAQKFDEKEARFLICKEYVRLINKNPGKNISIISGLTNLGIPKIAYENGALCGFKTVGVACNMAKDYECFPVDEEILVGDEWGDESLTFISMLDELIRIGGGKQSLKECDEARARNIPVTEIELPAL